MPLNPMENMPDNLRRRNISVNRFSVGSEGPKVNGQSYVGRSVVFDASECLDNVPVQSYISSSNHNVNALIQHTKGEVHAVSQAKVANIDIIKHPQQVAHSQPCMVAQIQAREADVRALSGLTRALDTKVSSAVVNMRQRNTHPGNLLPPWLKPPPVLDDRVAPTSSADNSSLNSQESESNVVEIVKGSRFRAQTMVDVAKKAMSSMKEGEDAFVKIGEALSKLQVMSDSEVSVMVSLDPVNGNQLNSEPLVTGHHLYNNDACRYETQIPSDLISSCVATLLMIQSCTERQYPPADVAQILDLAVTNLHPRCPQNLPIYREIQMCMGRIKTQILALIPT